MTITLTEPRDIKPSHFYLERARELEELRVAEAARQRTKVLLAIDWSRGVREARNENATP
jgi:hypothetical protein